MELSRKPTLQEEKLLEILVQKASIKFSSDWKVNLLVQPMDDGGMGSLCLFPNGKVKKDRTMGQRVSEIQFTDQDGIKVIASLNIDNDGDLYELDIWKTNFNPLIEIPKNLE